ncbi:MAG: hypothetical protein KBD78_05355 [Oligoflexales bacterium]|nr:hypothetical protein [Oligoflexales bacterium]
MIYSKYIQKYLAHYSETELKKIDLNILPNYERLVVMPAFAEALQLQDAFESAALAALFAQKKTLIIIVINEGNQTSIEDSQKNSISWRFLSEQGNSLYKDPENYWFLLEKNCYFDCLIINHFQSPFKFHVGEGVGKARKIGFDIGLRILAESKLSYPWVYSIDADTTLPLNYFSRDLEDVDFITHKTRAEQKTGAYVLNFHHKAESPTLKAAVQRYEKYLYSYYENLRNIQSPYAYVSIGSALVVSLEHYAKVRGMPKRLAGEDFHLLNKIAKDSSITTLSSPSVTIAARISQRTPFGTGQALLADLEAKNTRKYSAFNQKGYDHLHLILKAAEHALTNNELNFKLIVSEVSSKLHVNNLDLMRVYQANDVFKIDNMVKVAKLTSNNIIQQKKSFHQQFDALKTFQVLKFLSSPPTNLPLSIEI